MKQSSRAGDIILALFFYVPVVWGALLIAQSLGRGLPELLTNLTTALQHPLDIHWTDKSLLSILICTGLYIMGLCVYASEQRRTRTVRSTAPPPGALPGRSTPCSAKKRTRS